MSEKKKIQKESPFRQMLNEPAISNVVFQVQKNNSSPVDDENLKKNFKKNAETYVQQWDEMAKDFAN